MLILVTSASGINGNGYGALLAFKRDRMVEPCKSIGYMAPLTRTNNV